MINYQIKFKLEKSLSNFNELMLQNYPKSNKHIPVIYSVKTMLLLLVNFCFAINVSSQINVVTDRPSAVYEEGVPMNFLLNSNSAGQANYSIYYDQYAPPIQAGVVNLFSNTNQSVSYQTTSPGAVICSVQKNGQVNKTAALIAPFKINALESEPADFDAFWSQQKNALNAIPPDVRLNYYFKSANSTTYRLNMANINGRRVYGYITIPDGPGPFPAIITLPSFGSGANLAKSEEFLAEQAGVISISLGIHNAEADQVDPLAYQPDNFQNRNENYYKQAILGGLRAIDYVFTRTDFNGNLGVMGVSQGGGLAIMLAGLDNRVKLLINSNPALAQHAGLKYNRASGFPYYIHKGRQLGIADQTVLNGVRYYDAIYFARRYFGPSLSFVSLLDEVVPPATSLAVYNQLRGQKILMISQKLGHNHPAEYWNGRYDFIRKFFPETTNTSISSNNNTGYYADAGQDLQIALGSSVNLVGKIYKNNTENYNWPVKWEIVSAPGNVVFSNSNNRNTSVQFHANGKYTLRFSAEDSQSLQGESKVYTISDDVEITVGEGVIDQTPPTVFLNTASQNVTTNFSISINFSEPVNGLEATDFEISNGTISNFYGSGQNFTIEIIPQSEGVIRISLPANRATDTANNGNQASNILEVSFSSNSSNCDQISNLALNGVATQSSVIYGATASNAKDGNTNGDFNASSVCATDFETNPWWEIDLGAAKNIESIHVWNRSDNRRDRLSNYYVMVSDTPFSSHDLNTVLNQSSIEKYYYQGQAEFPTIVPVSRTGRYVRVQLNYAEHLTITEIEIKGCSQIDDPTPDQTAPEVVLSTASNEANSSFQLRADFSEAVTGLTISDIHISNGVISNLFGSGDIYNMTITPIQNGVVSMLIPSNVVTDLANNGNKVSNLLTVNYTGGNSTQAYCTVEGVQPWWDWISKVQLGSFGHYSEKSKYSDFTDRVIYVNSNRSYFIKLSNSYDAIIYEEYWRVWIDYNQNGSFEDAGELVFYGNGTYTISGSVRIPADAKTGQTRMRVSMQRGGFQSSCNNVVLGEVEDYSVNISAAASARQALFFTAQKEGRSVAINWISSTGNINDYFEIQHAVDGVSFKTIAELENKSNSTSEISYHYLDRSPSTGKNFYRIKQIYKDGGFSLSDIQLINFDLDLDRFQVFPNPTDAEVFVNLRKHIGLPCQLELYTLLGKKVLQKEIEAIPAHPIKLDLTQQNNGIYMLYIKIKEKRSFSKKIILNRIH